VAKNAAKKAAVSLDRIDFRILEALRDNGRITRQQLSEKVTLSASACLERVRQMEDAGIIGGYTARIDFQKALSLSLYLVTIKLRNFKPGDDKRFESAIARSPQVLQVWAVMGPIDYVMLACAASAGDYEAFITGLLSSGAGDFDYVTYPANRTVKFESAPPMVQPGA
jgi:Lrp/AsnC family transcriptional regulator of ectoine degradation